MQKSASEANKKIQGHPIDQRKIQNVTLSNNKAQRFQSTESINMIA